MNNPTENTAKAINTMRLNGSLKLVDEAAQRFTKEPEEQCGVLFMAHVLAVRRVLDKHKITDRGRRLRIIKTTVAEFESKLRKYVSADPRPGEVLTMQENGPTAG